MRNSLGLSLFCFFPRWPNGFGLVVSPVFFVLTCPSSTHRRGLNPPHRVKSISMTTFTQQEIEFLQKHSNEVSHTRAHRRSKTLFLSVSLFIHKWYQYVSWHFWAELSQLYWHSSVPTSFLLFLAVPSPSPLLSPLSPTPHTNPLSPHSSDPPPQQSKVCKHIWLGLYDDRASVVPDFREPQKVKEFLQEKYEKKRW